MDKSILNLNPWWESGKINKTKLGNIEREVFETLIKELGSQKVLCLLGPRRAGKTTLIYELINSLLAGGLNPKRILFMSFDNSKIRNLDFDEVLNEQAEMIEESLDQLKEPLYVFMDEIHKWEDWGNKVKSWQDLGYKIKFVLSGSSSSRILKGSGESLLGRIIFEFILPLSYKEIINYKFKGFPLLRFKLTDYDSLKKAYHRLLPHRSQLLITLRNYLIRGGFPEVYHIENMDLAFEILKDYKTLALNRDILEEKDIKEPRILNDFFDLLTDYISQRINYAQFASILKVKIDTIKNYFSYFEEAYLIYSASAYSKSMVINTRKEKKLFFFDCGLRNALILKDINEEEIPKCAENAAFIHLYYLKRRDLFPKIFYWMSPERFETDLIMPQKPHPLPIEVKYRDKVKESDLKGLLSFMDAYKLKESIVITKEYFNLTERFKYIPLWLFLLSDCFSN